MNYNKIILGAGMFGLYAAIQSVKKGENVLVLEYDDAPFKRASMINQARVHNGYHYPRSYLTAKKSSNYFDKFVTDYDFAILREFKQIYATSNKFSYTNAEQFATFCAVANIPTKPIDLNKYFKPNCCDGAFETLEYTFDAKMICEHMMMKLNKQRNFTILYNTRIKSIEKKDSKWNIITNNITANTQYLLNMTYASLNQVLLQTNLEPFKLQYELCEMILCSVSNNIKNFGFTVMDGPFFSLMPFGKTNYHSLTTVEYTPHLVSNNLLPTFSCQKLNINCSNNSLANCNNCQYKPNTDFTAMSKLIKKYFRDDIEIKYHKSLFSIKTIPISSQVDDSRPTIIKSHCDEPKFVSVLSGKINTIYDLNEVL